MNDEELFSLFLSMAGLRLEEAKHALDHRPVDSVRLHAALVPLSVDALLVGAEGHAALAIAIAQVGSSEPERASAALALLQQAIGALENGDASGARADEASLISKARTLAGNADVTQAVTHILPVSSNFSSKSTSEHPESAWVPSLPEDLINAFLEECQERIDSMSSRILELEHHGVEAGAGELVRGLFRDLHTLKGSAGFAGLKPLHALAHAAEDLVVRIRDGTAACDKDAIDALLLTLDRFRTIVDRAASRSRLDVDIEPALARLLHPHLRVSTSAKMDDGAGVALAKAVPLGVQTLRVEFERVDQLQDQVNELVIARSRLTSASEGQYELAREVGRIRRKVSTARSADSAEPAKNLIQVRTAEALARVEHVLVEGALEAEGALSALGAATAQLRDQVMRLRMVPIARLFTKHQRTVRDLAGSLRKKVAVTFTGQNTELDKILVEALEDPLIHLVRNAMDHGIETPDVRTRSGKPETGVLHLSAQHRGGAIVIQIQDDGAGIDPAQLKRKAIEAGLIDETEAEQLDERGALELIFRAGFSTAKTVTDVSGRGVGMDVVRDAIERLKGSIEIISVLGQGTTFELRLPLTLAVAHVLLLRVNGQVVALPIDAVAHGAALNEVEMEVLGGRTFVIDPTQSTRRHVPLIDLSAALGLGTSTTVVRGIRARSEAQGHIVLLDAPLSDLPRLALLCDGLAGRREVVVKALGPLLTKVPCVAGASLIGDQVVLLLDVATLARRGLDDATPLLVPSVPRDPSPSPHTQIRPRILVAEDTDVIREAICRALEQAGYECVGARDGQEAIEIIEGLDRLSLVTTDVVMPRMDGYALTTAIRGHSRHSRVPIVMVSSRDQRVDILAGYDAGVDAYVTKPADISTLISTVARLLEQGTMSKNHGKSGGRDGKST